MIDKRIELSSSYIEVHINDDYNYLDEILKLQKVKIIVYLNDYLKFEENYKYLFNIPFNKHIQLRANKHTLNKIDMEIIKNNFIIKNIEIKDYHYYINCFTVEEMHNSLIINNQKIIDKIDLLQSSINSLSKAHELAYTANAILNEYKETDSNLKAIKQKLSYVNSLASKM